MTTYLGVELLDQDEHNRVEPRRNTLRRSFEVTGSTVGARRSDDRGGTPIVSRPFSWFAEGRAAIQVMRDFLAARRGRAVPFWIPTYQRDLTLTQATLSGDTQITIARLSYTDMQFPNSGARRHVRMASPGLATILRRITGSNDPGNGLTEVLSFDATVGAVYPTTTMISFVTLCRLEDDVNEITWHNLNFAELQFSAVEIPREAPT